MIYESIKMVFKVFKTNKMRTFLTMLGIIIGIFSITIIFAISSSTKNSISKELASLDLSEIQVMIYGTEIDGKMVINIPTSEIMELENEDAINSVYISTDYMYKEMIKKGQGDDDYSVPKCTGVNYQALNNLKIVEGRKFTKLDDDNRLPFCIIQTSLAEEMFDEENVVGKTVKINGFEMEIIGRFDEITNVYSSGATVYVLDSFAKDYFQTSQSDYGSMGLQFTVKPTSVDEREDAVQAINEKLTEYMTKDDFFVAPDMTTITEQANSIVGIIELVFGGVAGLSLLVGGIGIMNIMLVSVNERIKEIGIRMALGATAGNIKTQFLIEGVMLTILSGIIGMLLASGAIALVNSIISGIEEIQKAGFVLGTDFGVMIKTILFCGGIGIIFGLYPAKKASELNPIDALRYE